MKGKTLATIGISAAFVLFSLSAWFGCDTLGGFFFAEGVLTGVALLVIFLVYNWEGLINS